MNATPSPDDIERLRGRLETEAESAGYSLNPDHDFASGLAEGLLINEQRYGYRACPCRLAHGDADADRDIVCPCDYRDADLLEWGSCFCGLYVSDDVRRGEKPLGAVPERRPPVTERSTKRVQLTRTQDGIRVWRCRVCGYLCARERPPSLCPICKASGDRFEMFKGWAREG